MMPGARSSQAAKVEVWVLQNHPSVKPIYDYYDKTPMRNENNPQAPWQELFRRTAREGCGRLTIWWYLEQDRTRGLDISSSTLRAKCHQ